MKKRLIYALCLSLAFAPFAQAADSSPSKPGAQQPPGPPKYFAKNASAEYKKKMEVANVKLKRMEDRLDKIEKNRVFLKGEMDSMNMDLDQYGNDMWNLYNEAVGRVKEAGDTQGKKGGNEEFLYFEDNAQAHAKRMKALEAKHQRIENDIKNGKVKPGKDIIDTMTPQEKDEFKKSLTPEGRKEIQKAYPKMASSSGLIPATQDFDFANLTGSILMWPGVLSINDVCSDFSRTIGNFLVSPAEAGCAYGCYVTCAATLGFGCAICVIAAGGAAYDAYTRWRSCMSSCSCAWYRPWCCAKKTACTALFLATLA